MKQEKPKKEEKTSSMKLLDKKPMIKRFIYPLLLIVIFANVYPYIFDSKLAMLGDNAGYYILGKSIATGQGYSSIHVPDNPPANWFPPGYPVIIAAGMKILGSDLSSIKMINGFFLLLSVLSLYFVFRKILDNSSLAFVISALILLNANLLKFSTIIMSEVPYLFVSTIVFLLVYYSDENKKFYKNWHFLASIIIAAGVFYVRTAGVALLGGIVLYYIFKKKWSYIIAFITGYVALVIPWIIRGQNLGGSGYIKQLMSVNPYRPELGKAGILDYLTRFYENFIRYFSREIPDGIFKWYTVEYKEPIAGWEWLLGAVLVALLVFGFLKIKNRRPLIFGYVGGSFGILLLWPDVWTGIRFALPLVPFMMLFLFNGVYEIFVWLFAKLNFKFQFSPFVLGLAVFLFMPAVQELHASKKYVYTDAYQNYFKVARWAAENTPEDAIICCRKPQLFYLYSNRKVVGYSNTLDKMKLVENLKKSKADYVVLEQLGYASTGRYLYPAVKDFSLLFPVVHATGEPQTFLLKFIDDYKYEGDLVEGSRQGNGTFVWGGGNMYVGQWDKNQRHGKGEMRLRDGSYFTGEFFENTRRGFGAMQLSDGRRYEGMWNNDAKEGQGTFTWPGGNKYEGNWLRDQRHGYGVMKLSNGERFEGNWQNDRMEGKGQFYYQNGSRYDGLWKNGMREGKGKLFLPNGNAYVGEWKNDKLQGYVVLVDKKGNAIKAGDYQNGELK